MIPTIEIDTNGDIQTLYTDDINLYELGTILNVKRASHIKFDESNQEWEVINAVTNKIVYRTKNRSEAIEWEINNFSPGGKFYDQATTRMA